MNSTRDAAETGYYNYITKAVYDAMFQETKISNGKNMWESRQWKTMNDLSIYRSNWGWVVD